MSTVEIYEMLKIAQHLSEGHIYWFILPARKAIKKIRSELCNL